MPYAKNLKVTAPAKVAATRVPGILALSLASAGIAHAAQGLTREQVQAQLVAAERTGDIVEPWTQLRLNELYPSEYPAKAAQMGNERSHNRIISDPTATAAADEISEDIAIRNQYSDQANSALAAARRTGEHGQAAD